MLASSNMLAFTLNADVSRIAPASFYYFEIQSRPNESGGSGWNIDHNFDFIPYDIKQNSSSSKEGIHCR